MKEFTMLLHSLMNCLNSWWFWAMIILCFLDLVTGYSYALINHKLTSDLSYKGLIKQVVLIITPLTLYPLFDLGGYAALGDGVVCAFMIPNSLSLVENLHKLGVDMPEWFVKFFDSMGYQHSKKDEKTPDDEEKK